jgi:hypothetical protein
MIGILWWDIKTTLLITKDSYPTQFPNFPSSLLLCLVTCLSDSPTLSFSLHSLTHWKKNWPTQGKRLRVIIKTKSEIKVLNKK